MRRRAIAADASSTTPAAWKSWRTARSAISFGTPREIGIGDHAVGKEGDEARHRAGQRGEVIDLVFVRDFIGLAAGFEECSRRFAIIFRHGGRCAPGRIGKAQFGSGTRHGADDAAGAGLLGICAMVTPAMTESTSLSCALDRDLWEKRGRHGEEDRVAGRGKLVASVVMLICGHVGERARARRSDWRSTSRSG